MSGLEGMYVLLETDFLLSAHDSQVHPEWGGVAMKDGKGTQATPALVMSSAAPIILVKADNQRGSRRTSLCRYIMSCLGCRGCTAASLVSAIANLVE